MEEDVFRHDQMWVLFKIRIVTSIISTIACSFTIFTIIFVLKSLKKSQTTRIVFNLSLSSLGACLASLLSFEFGFEGNGSRWCKAQGFLLEFTQQAEISWSVYVKIVQYK